MRSGRSSRWIVLAALLASGLALAQAKPPRGSGGGGGSLPSEVGHGSAVLTNDGGVGGEAWTTFTDVGSRGYPIDGSTLIFYKMNAASGSGETDYGTDGLNLSVANQTGTPSSTYGPGGLNTGARQTARDAGFVTSSEIGPLRGQLANGAWTISMWFRPYQNALPTANESILLYVTGGNANDLTMPLVYLAFEATTWDAHLQQVEYYAYQNHTTSSHQVLSTVFSWGQWAYLTLTRTAPSGGNVTYQAFVNCVPTDAAQTVAAPSQIPDAGEYMSIGGTTAGDGTAPNAEYFGGDVSGVKIASVVETQNQICADMLRTRP